MDVNKIVGMTFADGESGGGLCGEGVGRCMKLPRTFFRGDVTGWITVPGDMSPLIGMLP